MSESMASLVSGGLAQQAQQNSQFTSGGVNQAEDANGEEFPSLFHKLISDSAEPTENSTVTTSDAMATLPSMPLQQLTVNGVTALDANLTLPSAVNPDAQVLPLMPMQDGNALPMLSPQMAWSGYVAYADNRGAAAQSFLGNDALALQSTPVVDASLNGSIQRSQQQLKDFLALQPTGLMMNSDPALAEQAGDLMERLLVAGQERPVSESASIHQANTSSTTPLSGLSSPLLAGDGLTQSLAGQKAGEAIQVMPQHPQWGNQVGNRVHWMIGQGLQQADIRLNPPELGSLEIRIQLQGDQASVSFTSPSGVVRDALDAAMPRLREMLEQSGLSLADVNVSSQSPGQQGEQAGQMAESERTAQNGEVSQSSEDVTMGAENRIQSGTGMLDVYA